MGIIPLGFSQTSEPQKSASVTLRITLADIKSISVNASSSTVNLQFNSLSDFQSGVSVNEASQLNVFSSGAYKISVSAKGDFVSTSSSTNTLSSSAVKVSLASSEAVTTYSNVALSTTNQLVAQSSTGTLKTNYDVSYSASVPDYANKAAGTYETVVTYTIESN